MSEFMIKLGVFVSSLVLVGIPFLTGVECKKDFSPLVRLLFFLTTLEVVILIGVMCQYLGVW